MKPLPPADGSPAAVLDARIDELTARVRRIVEGWLQLLELARARESVTVACEELGYNRPAYYRALDAFRYGGLPNLTELAARCVARDQSLSEEIDEAILAMSVLEASWGRIRLANELRRRGLPVSPSRVRTAWRRHGVKDQPEPEPGCHIDGDTSLSDSGEKPSEPRPSVEFPPLQGCGTPPTPTVGNVRGLEAPTTLQSHEPRRSLGARTTGHRL